MTALSVNLNKIAWLRNAREGAQPDIVHAAETVLGAGAAGLTVHPRPDLRHIRPADVHALAAVVARHPGIEYNIEGNPFAGPRDNGFPGFDALIEAARPVQVTLVPDDDQQLTSDHGFDLRGDQSALKACIERYQALGARVSLFMDPDPDQISRAAALGVERIELYTGPFAEVVLAQGLDASASVAIFEQFATAAAHAQAKGLAVNAGHDLDLPNLGLFLTIPGISEVSIGHALISRALDVGLHAITAEFKRITDAATPAISH
ncbi:MAG: pyridoxine 5'-phosphate synthase [Pseudomonadota bacterium]